jgi:hypothetical protein
MIRPAFLLLCALALIACSRSPYEGFKRVGDDVHLRYHVLGDGETLPMDSDHVRIRIRAGRPGGGAGELFSTEAVYEVNVLRNGAFLPVLARIHEGDSMSLIAPVEAWPWSALMNGAGAVIPDTGMVQMEISLIAIRTPAMARMENERLRRNDPLGFENELLQAYLVANGAGYERWGTSGMYYRISGEALDTAEVRLGDHVTIAYKGRRVEDGVLFDDTDRNGVEFSFRFGDKDQVMQGLEVAVHLLREGQQGSFLFPSEMAFGSKGIPAVLDPYMPVEYTVRLVKVERAGP